MGASVTQSDSACTPALFSEAVSRSSEEPQLPRSLSPLTQQQPPPTFDGSPPLSEAPGAMGLETSAVAAEIEELSATDGIQEVVDAAAQREHSRRGAGGSDESSSEQTKWDNVRFVSPDKRKQMRRYVDTLTHAPPAVVVCGQALTRSAWFWLR